MVSRPLQIAVIICWLASMSWLAVEKIYPLLDVGDQPNFRSELPEIGAEPIASCWELYWKQRHIGWAATRSVSLEGGQGQIHSVVRLENFPVDEMLADLLGPLHKLLGRATGAGRPLDMDVITQMVRDRDGQLQTFDTTVHVGPRRNLINLRGSVLEHKLQLRVFTLGRSEVDGAPESIELYRKMVELPENALVGDSFSPRARLDRLRVGQSWTHRVVQPFPPNSPMQMVQARVEREELFIWNGEALRAFQVVYYDEAGSGLRSVREPVGKMWVRHDGEVLEQEVRIANLQFRFVRLQEESCNERARQVDPSWPE